MTTDNVIAGLSILIGYYNKPDGYYIHPMHDAICACATDKPVIEADLARLIKLGWLQTANCHKYQSDRETNGRFVAKYYDPTEDWVCYV